MDLFASLGAEYEQVVFAHDPSVGLRTIVAVYSTAIGPALGGTRIWPFASEEEALRDVLRLAKAMAYKAAAANLSTGGGKAVVIADPRRGKTPELLRAYGRVVDGLGGAYITTADVGSTSADLDVIAEVTRHVAGTTKGSGDPSRVTAFGVWHGMRAVAEEAFGEPSLKGRHVMLQGTGKVGSALARLLAEEGARLTLADLDESGVAALAKELGAAVEPADRVLSVECDVYAPCALGPVVSAESAASLRCRAVAGAANNQLDGPGVDHVLADAGVLWAPDYVINAGGLINVEDELHGYDRDRAMGKAAAIEGTLREIFGRARAERTTPSEAADRLAGDRIAAAKAKRGW